MKKSDEEGQESELSNHEINPIKKTDERKETQQMSELKYKIKQY